MTSKHFAGDLRIARFVGADETEVGEPKKEQESAKAGKQEPICSQTDSLRAAEFRLFSNDSGL
jgi:hypothetical protein